jgi:hypothetical protein
MKVFLAAVIFVALAVIGLGVNIFFRGKPFPDGEISTNPEMRKRGIRCAKEEELELLRGGKKHPSCDGNYSDACRGCAFFETEK